MTQCRCAEVSRDITFSTSSITLQLTASSLAPANIRTAPDLEFSRLEMSPDSIYGLGLG